MHRACGLAVFAAAACASVSAPGDPPRYALAINNHAADGYDVVLAEPGGTMRDLSRDPGTDWVYASSAGELIVVSDRGGVFDPGTYRLYRQDVAAGTLRPAAGATVNDSYVGIYPDGRLVVSVRLPEGRRLAEISADGEIVRLLTDGAARDADADVAPDGSFMIFRSNRSGSSELWRLDLADGSGAVQLTNDPADDGLAGYGGAGPGRLSPDGRQIAWMCPSADERQRVCVMSSDGKGPAAVYDPGALKEAIYPSWHPIAPTLIVGVAAPNEDYRLHTLDLKTGAFEPVEHQPEGSNLSAVWVAVE